LSQRVFLLKHKNNPYPYIRKAKIFILSSRYEGYPNVLLEAQALRKKIISTNCSFGPSEILGNGRFGYLVNPGDYKKLGLKMLQSLNTKKKVITLEALKKRNSLDLVASRYCNLFDNLNEK
jgi:glycosyltransferase involved in cell wall biosynthesis